jgi:hypothetical protein
MVFTLQTRFNKARSLDLQRYILLLRDWSSSGNRGYSVCPFRGTSEGQDAWLALGGIPSVTRFSFYLTSVRRLISLKSETLSTILLKGRCSSALGT